MSIKFEVDPLSVAVFQNQLKRFATILKKDAPEALKVGTIYFCKSMAASTKVAPKLRKIEKNPNPRAGSDRRVAPLGVYRYNSKTGERYFKPIYHGGEYGAKYRFVSKNGVEMLVGHQGGKAVYQRFDRMSEGIKGTNADIMKDKRRKILRSGLAKRSWMWIVRDLYGKNAPEGGFKQPSGSIFASKGGTGYGAFVHLQNKLRYITKALKGTPSAVMSDAMVKASNQIRKAVERALEKGGAKK